MKISIIFLYFLFLPNFVFAQSDNLLKSLDKKIYNPTDFGLSSLSFEARIDNLTETLKAQTIIPIVSEVYFQVTWDRKNGFKVNTMNLPKGFLELKASLESLLVDKLGFFIPVEIYEQIKDYGPTVEKNDFGIQYTLEDKTYLKDITRIEIIFDNEKKLREMNFYGLNIRTKNTFSFEVMDDSQKWLLKNFLVENIQLQGVIAASYQVEYTQVGKYHFPSNIDISTSLQSLPGSDGQKQVFSETKSVIKFTNFQVK